LFEKSLTSSRRSAPTLKQWLLEEPFSLTMSSGFFSFFAHSGVMSVLEQAGLGPRRISGSSASALVAAMWAAGLAIKETQRVLFGLQRKDLWDPALGPGLLRGKRFEALLQTLLPVARFEHCRIPVAISAFDLVAMKNVVLSSGNLARAIHASCAVPLLFQPVRINHRLMLDGGIADRPGLAGMPQNERVFYHHIASRSPWRRPHSPALRVPPRNKMTTLIIHDLPRVYPLALGQGIKAFHHAQKAAALALERPVTDQRVHLGVAD
jgi:NTE family protein